MNKIKYNLIEKLQPVFSNHLSELKIGDRILIRDTDYIGTVSLLYNEKYQLYKISTIEGEFSVTKRDILYYPEISSVNLNRGLFDMILGLDKIFPTYSIKEGNQHTLWNIQLKYDEMEILCDSDLEIALLKVIDKQQEMEKI